MDFVGEAGGGRLVGGDGCVDGCMFLEGWEGGRGGAGQCTHPNSSSRMEILIPFGVCVVYSVMSG